MPLLQGGFSSNEEPLQEFRPLFSILLDADSQEYLADLGDCFGLRCRRLAAGYFDLQRQALVTGQVLGACRLAAVESVGQC